MLPAKCPSCVRLNNRMRVPLGSPTVCPICGPTDKKQARCSFLQDGALGSLLLSYSGTWVEDSPVFWVSTLHEMGVVCREILPDSLIKDTLEIPLGQSRALQVLVGADLLGHDQGLVVRNWLHSLGSQALQGSGVLSQVKLSTDQDDWDRRCVVVDLGEPLELRTHSQRVGH